MSILEDLEDHVYAEASRLVVELCESIRDSVGRKPTSLEFLALLSRTLESTNEDLFQDISPAGIKELIPRLKKNPRKVEPGTVVGIPSSGGRWFFVVYLTSNTYGDAFGALRGEHASLMLRPSWRPECVGKPVYSSLRPVRDGQWRPIDIRADLLRLFPGEPEIYHRKSGHNQQDPLIGEYGSAETPSHVLRAMSKDEAESVGLLSGEYEQCLLPERFVQYLERHAKVRGANVP